MDHHVLLFLLLIILASALPPSLQIISFGVLAAQNITLDDGDPSIVYAPPGAWVRSAQTTLDVGGSHLLTQNPNATASFNFTGVAIFYLSPLWPYRVGVAISLDSAPPTIVDLVDHSLPDAGQGAETVPSMVVWNATGLENKPHTLVISVPQGQPFAIMDALIFTNPIDTPLSSSVPPSSPSLTLPMASSTTSSFSATTPTGRVVASGTTDPSVSATRKIKVAPVVIGVIFGLIVLLILVLGIWHCIKQRRRPMSEAWTVGADESNMSSPSRSRPTSGKATMGGFGMGGAGAGGKKSTNPTPFVDPQLTSPASQAGAWDYGKAAPPLVGGIQQAPYYPQQQQQVTYTYQDSTGTYTTVPQPYHYQPPQGPVDPNARAPNRYQPGNTLSTITEKSTPGMPGSGGYGTRSLPPTSPASSRTLDLDYQTRTPSTPTAYTQSIPEGRAYPPNTPTTGVATSTPDANGVEAYMYEQDPTSPPPRDSKPYSHRKTPSGHRS